MQQQKKLEASYGIGGFHGRNFCFLPWPGEKGFKPFRQKGVAELSASGMFMFNPQKQCKLWQRILTFGFF